jgi:hypothetical protein
LGRIKTGNAVADHAPIILANRISVNRLAMTGALSTTLLFMLCWAVGNLGFVGSHAFIALFTLAPVLSVTALCIGATSAAGFGDIGGAAIALFYNLLGPRTASPLRASLENL